MKSYTYTELSEIRRELQLENRQLKKQVTAAKSVEDHYIDQEKKLRKVIGLLNSMIYCGDKHSDQSERLVRLAIGKGGDDES